MDEQLSKKKAGGPTLRKQGWCVLWNLSRISAVRLIIIIRKTKFMECLSRARYWLKQVLSSWWQSPVRKVGCVYCSFHSTGKETHRKTFSRTSLSRFSLELSLGSNKVRIWIHLSDSTPEVPEVKVTQSCLTLCDPMDCSLPGSSVHGILPGKNTGVVAIPFSKGSSQPRDRTQGSLITGRLFTIWAPRGAHSMC